jgi:hypothetical protein
MRRRAFASLAAGAAVLAFAGPAGAASRQAPAPQNYDLLVFATPTPDEDVDYMRWLQRDFLPKILAVPGVESAQRFALSDIAFSQRANPSGAPKPAKYLTLFKIVTPDIAAFYDDLRRKGLPDPDYTATNDWTYRALGPALAGENPAAQGTAKPDLYLNIVFSDPRAGREAEYNQWYDKEHLPGAASLPGYEGQRFVWADAQWHPLSEAQKKTTRKYLAVYSVTTYDVKATLAKTFQRIADNRKKNPNALAQAPYNYDTDFNYTYKAIGPVQQGTAKQPAQPAKR